MRSISDGAYQKAIKNKIPVMFFVSDYQKEPLAVLPSAEGSEGTLPDPAQIDLTANIIIGIPVREELDAANNLWVVFEESTTVSIPQDAPESEEGSEAPAGERLYIDHTFKFENRLNQSHIVYSVTNLPANE